ncbi:MAG: histidine phosphatase family protein [Thermomicrobiales bacterium]
MSTGDTAHRVFLVRHGLAAAPDDLRLPGADLSLRPEGERQACSLAARLCMERPATIYSSEARRAWQTAEAIARVTGAPLAILPELREIDFGAWSGRTYTEIVAANPGAADYFADPEVLTPPAGEAAIDAARRVLATLTTIGEGEGGVVVGHAGSLRLALALALEMPLAASWRLGLDCAHVSRLDWTEAGPIVRYLNDGCHLEAAGNRNA